MLEYMWIPTCIKGVWQVRTSKEKPMLVQIKAYRRRAPGTGLRRVSSITETPLQSPKD